MATTRHEALPALERFPARYGSKHPKATESLVRQREAVLALFGFPAEQWVHCVPPAPSSRRNAPVRPQTRQTKNCASRSTLVCLAFKLTAEAPNRWRRIRVPEKVAKVLAGRCATKTAFRCQTTHRRSTGKSPNLTSIAR